MCGGKIGKMVDHYEVLGVKTSATKKEIRKAYKELVKKHHPDVSGYDSSKYFTQIIQAYEILSDEKRRAAYDAFHFAGFFGSSPLFCGECGGAGFEETKCYLCNGVGHAMKQVPYGKYKVESKIICTLCYGSGIIKTVCFSCS